MNFRGFLLDSENAAQSMVDEPGDRWREGFGLASPEQELAAVIHYAKKGFPADGKSLLIHPPMKQSALYRELMQIAEQLHKEGRLVISTDGARHTYIGEEGHVREGMRLTIRRKPDLFADEEQHRRMGELLGYKPEAIDEFIRRIRSKKALLQQNQ